MAYDSQFFQLLSNIPDSKGCHLFAINEKSYTLITANKKKLSLYGWQAPGFVLRKDFTVTETPRVMQCINGSSSVIIGHKNLMNV